VGSIDEKINSENYDNLKFDTYFKGILRNNVKDSIEQLKSHMKSIINDMKSISDTQFAGYKDFVDKLSFEEFL
jgi:hypothetical protein